MISRALASRLSRLLLTTCALSGAAGCDARSEEKTCAFLSISECSSRPYCSVRHARRADTTAQCLAPSEPVACTDLKQACDDSLSLALNGDDQLYVLPTTCLPSSWEAQSDPDGEIVNWPDCE